MITSANAANAIGDRYTPQRRAALAVGGATSGASLGGAYAGRKGLQRYFRAHQERITGKPTWVRVDGKMRPSHGIKPIWQRGYFKQGRTQQILEKHGASLARMRAALNNPAWKRARYAGLAGLGLTGAAAGAMAVFPAKKNRS